MLLLSEYVESQCIPLLQCNVKFTCLGKTLRHGKLLLVAQRSHYISFTITNQHGEPKQYELPYPFEMYFCHDNNYLVLDYTLDTLCCDNTETFKILHSLENTDKKHRLYDKIIYVEKL